MKAEANMRPVYRRAASENRRARRSIVDVMTPAGRRVFSTAEFF